MGGVITGPTGSVVDPHTFDPAFQLDADPDPNPGSLRNQNFRQIKIMKYSFFSSFLKLMKNTYLFTLIKIKLNYIHR